jgi:hypothetical protein
MNNRSIPGDLTGPLKRLCRYSLSFNIWRGLVLPLVTDIHGDGATYKNTEPILELLIETHKCFWHTAGEPMQFGGAVAGHFQELIFAFKQAEKKDGRTVKLGAEGPATGQKIGGDVSQLLADGRNKTYQFKVSCSENPRAIKEHINKAGAQLTGQTGELPVPGSMRTIYMIVQDTLALNAYNSAQWQLLITEALDMDYVVKKNGVVHRTVTKADIKLAVDKVKILTNTTRFRFDCHNGVAALSYEEALQMDEAKYFTTSDGKFHRHWDWMRNTWWPANVNVLGDKADVILKTKENGLAVVGAFQKLPHQGLPF